jgi:uncharacterized membrane protein YesL
MKMKMKISHEVHKFTIMNIEILAIITKELLLLFPPLVQSKVSILKSFHHSMFYTINWIDTKTKAHELSSINEIPMYG